MHILFFGWFTWYGHEHRSSQIFQLCYAPYVSLSNRWKSHKYTDTTSAYNRKSRRNTILIELDRELSKIGLHNLQKIRIMSKENDNTRRKTGTGSPPYLSRTHDHTGQEKIRWQKLTNEAKSVGLKVANHPGLAWIIRGLYTFSGFRMNYVCSQSYCKNKINI